MKQGLRDKETRVAHHSVQQPEDLATKRIQFGREVLGPIFFDFCHRLHTHFLSYDNREAVFLFCARAGLRLQYFYELFLQSQNYSKPVNPHQLLWISRFMTAKGLYKRNPRTSFKLIAKEFNHTLVKMMLPCLLPLHEFGDKTWDFTDEFLPQILEARPDENIVQQIFASPGEFGQRLRQHYNQQSQLFEQQLWNLTGGKSVAVLVDSGWNGTTQRLLMEGVPEINWQGLYFGRMGSLQTNNWHFFSTIGLMFEAYSYNPKKPETCIHYHHHIIEDLLEPTLPSVEYLVAGEESHQVLPPEAYKEGDYWTPAEDEHHYQGVVEYLQSTQQRLSLLEVRKRSREAWKILDYKIRFPSPEDVKLVNVRSRSADFGKKEKNPVILYQPRFLEERTPEVRLRHGLWKQGQIAIEYPQQYHRKQEEFAEQNEPQPRKRLATPKSDNKDIAKVAVITRTKNRPVMLKRAAKSVANQQFQDLVWVVVNDGGDPEEVNQVVEQSPVDLRKVIVVHNPTSLGMEAASNRAISASDSKYIVIHDDDDTWQPEFLSRTVDFLENPPVASMKGVIAHAIRWSEVIMDEDYVELIDSCPYQDWVMTVPLYEMASMNMFAPISFLFSREVYDEIGGFDPTLPVLGDWDFNLRFLMKYDIGVIPEKLSNYHHRDYQKSGAYSNSVYGAVSKHQMYEAVVRNRGLRQLSEEGGLPLTSILSLGRATYDLRGMVQHIMQAVDQKL